MIRIHNQHAITTTAEVDDNSGPDDHFVILYALFQGRFSALRCWGCAIMGIEAYTATAVQKLIKLVTSSKGFLSSLKPPPCKRNNNLSKQ